MITSTPFINRLSNTLVSIALILLLMYLGKSILIPLSFACLFAILLMSPCNRLEKIGLSRGIAAMISLIIAIAIVFFVLYFISSQILSFREELPALGAQLYAAINNLEEWVQKTFHVSAKNMNEFLKSATSETLSNTSTIVTTTFASVSSTLIYIVLIPIYTFLLLLYRNLVVNFFIKSFSEEHSPRVYAILEKTRHVIKSYVVGLCIEMVTVAALVFIGFLILGVRYALLLAVITAVLNLIPYIGIFTACVLSLLISFTTNGAATLLGVAIVIFIVHLTDSNILLPKIVGSKVKINALVTILGVLVGHMIWGIPGMFLAIPIIAILKVVFDGVESLAAWGLLLGDEVVAVEVPKKTFFKLKKKVEKKDEQSLTE